MEVRKPVLVGGSIATENTEDTEMGEKDERTQQIVGAAIEVHLNFGCSPTRGRDPSHLSVTSVSSVAKRRLPDEAHIPNAAFFVPQIIGMYYVAKSLQGSAVDAHRREGGSLASSWGAAGIGIFTGIRSAWGIVRDLDRNLAHS